MQEYFWSFYMYPLLSFNKSDFISNAIINSCVNVKRILLIPIVPFVFPQTAWIQKCWTLQNTMRPGTCVSGQIKTIKILNGI